MDELGAADLFDDLWGGVQSQATIEEALKTLEDRRMTSVELEAVEHYAAEGGSSGVLAERAREVARAALAAAHAIAPRSAHPALAELETMRRSFQDDVVSLRPGLESMEPTQRVRRLANGAAYRSGKAKGMIRNVVDDRIDAFMAVRDLIDAAAYAGLLAHLLENGTARNRNH